MRYSLLAEEQLKPSRKGVVQQTIGSLPGGTDVSQALHLLLSNLTLRLLGAFTWRAALVRSPLGLHGALVQGVIGTSMPSRCLTSAEWPPLSGGTIGYS
jgi:hypothetical protein